MKENRVGVGLEFGLLGRIKKNCLFPQESFKVCKLFKLLTSGVTRCRKCCEIPKVDEWLVRACGKDSRLPFINGLGVMV